MITKLPLDIQRKIQNYICELYISEKKEMYKEVYHELLCGWWYYKQPDGSYLVYSTYSDIPTRLNLSLNEICVLSLILNILLEHLNLVEERLHQSL